MAHILQKENKAKEIYLTDAEPSGAKYLLIIYEDGSLKMEWCYEDIIEIQANPILSKIGKRMLLEFGEENLFGIRQKKAFQDEMGNLESIWEKIM